MQGRLGVDGPVALLTLPCPRFVAEAEIVPEGSSADARPHPLAERAAAIAARALGLGAAPRVDLRCTAPPGVGAGSSSMIALATVRAVAASAGLRLRPEIEAPLLLEIEGAVDPLMWPDAGALLWASRAARRLETFATAFRWTLVGGFDGRPQRTDPEDENFADISDLVAAFERAAEAGDRAAAAEIATQSALRNQALRPKPSFAAVRALAEELGAGVVVAHTGSALGLLLAPNFRGARRAAEALRRLGLDAVFVDDAGGADPA
ncbi:MAG: hypothetical protein AAFW46_16970 [Pseudomonadota bacterium]